MIKEANDKWVSFYKAHEGRSPRPTFLEALARFEPAAPDSLPRYAIDLGCGDGTETLALIQNGWQVLALDKESLAIDYVHAKVPTQYQAQLETKVISLEDLSLPNADFIYAGFSLPFCPPAQFETMWAKIVAAIQTGGRFAGQLFGDRDA